MNPDELQAIRRRADKSGLVDMRVLLAYIEELTEQMSRCTENDPDAQPFTRVEL